MPKIVDWDEYIGQRLKLRDLRVCFVVAQSGSLAKAAAQLRVSQPAVSQVVANLEHGLGVRLFDRTRRGVEPTPYGRALLSRSRAAFEELRLGIRDIESLADPEAGEVRIGSTAATTDTLLPHFIHRFSQRYPRVVVHVDDAPRPALDLSGLGNRKVDLILGRVSPPADKREMAEFNVETLFYDQLVIAAGSHNQLARHRKISLADLVDEPWILASPHSWNYSRLVEAFDRCGLEPPKASLVTFSVAVRTHLLTKGPYLTSFGRSAVLLNPNQQSLRILPVDLPLRPWPFAVLTLRDRALSPAVDRFIQSAREVASDLSKIGKPKSQLVSR